MSKYWEFIADCLRSEMADYGGLLHLFEAQQRSLFGREPESVLRFANEIQTQARKISQSRTRREEAVAAFAQENDRPLNSTLRALLPLIEADARPLLEALLAEVNTLLHRVRRASRRNHTLLARAVEVHQETLQHLRSHAFIKTYSPVVSRSPRRVHL